MKCLHLSDLHLGKRLIEVSLLEDQAYILQQITGIAEREKPEAVLISGDIYDRSNPPSEAMALFGSFIQHLAKLGCTVLVISGNHDSAERVSYLGELARENGVYLSPAYDGHIEPIELHDDYGSVFFYLMPYVHPENVRRFFPDEVIADANAAARLVLQSLSPDTACRNVILSHQCILGSDFDEREQRSVGTLDSVDASLYGAFDYVALGHIHKPQNVGRPDGTMRYCGTPLKYSKKEALFGKSVTLAELAEKGSVRVRTVPLVPLREMRQVIGRFDELLMKGPAPGTEDDYFFITLNDEEDIPNAAARLRERFGRVLALDFDNSRARIGGVTIETTEPAEDKTPLQLLMELYQLTHDRELSEEAQAFAGETIRKTEGFEA